jgi:hypothetical protein
LDAAAALALRSASEAALDADDFFFVILGSWCIY